MTTHFSRLTLYRAVGIVLVALFVGAPLAFAQTDSNQLSTSTEPLSLETASSTEVVAPVIKQPWFKLERLEGIVDQGDFVVGPGRAELEIKPGQTVVYEMSIANRISDNRRFELEIEDVSGTEDGNQAVVFLGESRGPYTIKDYISFPEDHFNLELGERARIPVTISIPADAEPGGYYGGVLVSTVKNDGATTEAGTAQSPIIARIGTLFFITVPGETLKAGETKSLSLATPKPWFEKGPIELHLLYENTGSVHLNPYGELRIRNFFGEEVGFVEVEPWFVLPKSLRTRTVMFDREVLFGRYTVTASINRGYDDVVDEVSTVFWVLPWKVLVSVFLFVFILLFSIRFFVRTFEFKRRA